jgi:hypothetical protein
MGERGATATPIASGTSDLVGVVAPTTGGMRLTGFSAAEGAASTATAIIRAGATIAGAIIAYISLASGGMTVQYFGDAGIDVSTGIFLERVTGTMAVVFYTRSN